MKNTLEILKQEDIDLVSLASPHILDSEEKLDCTLELLEAYDIYNISSKINRLIFENPFVIYVNNQRYMILMRTFISLIIIVLVVML